MLTLIVLSLIFVALILCSVVEPFNKRVRKWMRVARFYIRRLRATRRNLRKLPKTARKLWPVLKQKRAFKLFRLKLLQTYHHHHKKPASD